MTATEKEENKGRRRVWSQVATKGSNWASLSASQSKSRGCVDRILVDPSISATFCTNSRLQVQRVIWEVFRWVLVSFRRLPPSHGGGKRGGGRQNQGSKSGIRKGFGRTGDAGWTRKPPQFITSLQPKDQCGGLFEEKQVVLSMRLTDSCPDCFRG